MLRFLQVFFLSLLLSLLAASAAVMLPRPTWLSAMPWQVPPDARTAEIRVEVRGVISTPGEDLNIVLLAPLGEDDARLVLPLFVGYDDAAAIALRLEGRGGSGTGPDSPQPSPHPGLELPPGEDWAQALAADPGAEALGDTIRSLGGRLDRVVIDDPEPLASRGRIYLSQGLRAVDLPVPAADSIALALDSEVPIFVTGTLLGQAGMDLEDLERLQMEAVPPEEQEPLDPEGIAPPDDESAPGPVEL